MFISPWGEECFFSSVRGWKFSGFVRTQLRVRWKTSWNSRKKLFPTHKMQITFLCFPHTQLVEFFYSWHVWRAFFGFSKLVFFISTLTRSSNEKLKHRAASEHSPPLWLLNQIYEHFIVYKCVSASHRSMCAKNFPINFHSYDGWTEIRPANTERDCCRYTQMKNGREHFPHDLSWNFPQYIFLCAFSISTRLNSRPPPKTNPPQP